MSENLRVTMLLQGKSVDTQAGYFRAFEAMKACGRISEFRAFCYKGDAASPSGRELSGLEVRSLLRDVQLHMSETDSNVLFCQFFHFECPIDLGPFFKSIEALPSQPIIASSCGDPYGRGVFRVPKSLLRAAKSSDVVFSSSMGPLAQQFVSAGAKRVLLVPHASCDVRFPHSDPHPTESKRDFDIVFVGNRNGGRNFSRPLYWTGRRRYDYLRALTKRYGARLGVFGAGWSGLETWQGPIPYELQGQTYRRGRIVLGGVPASNLDYYMSDRPMIAMGEGVPFVDQMVPRVESIFVPGQDWLLYDSIESCFTVIDHLLSLSESERLEFGRQGWTAVRDRHRTSHRVELMIDVWEELLDAKRLGRQPRTPRLPYLAADINLEAELGHAAVGW